MKLNETIMQFSFLLILSLSFHVSKKSRLLGTIHHRVQYFTIGVLDSIVLT